jgi:pyrroloquinoline quinone biosynthesis protein B
MRIRLLGTAAGGGVPQWNCHCAVCRLARDGSGRVLARTQSSVAVSADGRRWFLLNASPDIRSQIESFPPLQPPSDRERGSPIEAVLVTNADLDHTLGLLLLREGEPLVVHASGNTQKSLGVSMGSLLNAFCGVRWVEPPVNPAPLLCRDGVASGMRYEAIELPGKAPRFIKGTVAGSSGHVVGYRITDERTGGRLLFLPGAAALEAILAALLPKSDALLFDGTFWSEREMEERGVGRVSASEMGHVPVSGVGGSLKVLADLKVPHKVYTHINNTNPILIEDSVERRAVEAAGCVVGYDGMELSI